MKYIVISALLLTAGCASVPPTNVHQPMTARPAPRMEVAGGNGSIFQANAGRPLFEDRRARYVGDTITVNIQEKTTASKTSNNKLERKSSNDTSITTMNGVPGNRLGNIGLNTATNSKFEGTGDAGNENKFDGKFTVTVIDVMPNGNLLVSGEKQLGIGNEQEFVRISGVVNPNFVNASNTINSWQLADARIEYKSTGQISDNMLMGWLSRAFMTLMPF